jgi:CBS domain-containing protein
MTTTSAEPVTRLEHARVADAMHAPITSCAADTPLLRAARTMAEQRIHALVVSGLAAEREPSGRPWGVVSALDVAGAVAAGAIDGRAGEVAATELVTIAPEESLERAAQVMAEHDCWHLIVVDRAADLPVGVVSTLDVARLLGESAPAG